MVASGSVVYEVNLVPDPAIESEFDEWLREHVREMLGLPGFIDATISRVEQEDGRATRSVQYELQDRTSLERYLSDQAAGMRQAAIDRFGDRFSATRRILVDGQRVAPGGALGACSNCEALLTGQYCTDCGQRAGSRMISLWELIREASEFLTTIDSRLWRTLGLLMFRPGRLTHDYLLGRRARYIPPLRLFIAFSLMFFFLLAIGTRLGLDDSSIVADGAGVHIQIGGDEADPAEASESISAADSALEPEPDAAAGPVAVAGGDAIAPGAENGIETDSVAASEDEPEAGSEEDPCDDLEFELGTDVEWLRAWLTEERLKATCRKVVVDHGASFAQALLENIPMMMFFFLPVMALVMKISYPLSRRYYVEHLLFLVHFHAFFYFILTLNLLAEWTFEGTNLPNWPAPALATVTLIYVPVYLFKSMRLVYGQSRMATLGKYALLGISYFLGLMTMFVITLMLTALTL